MRDGRNAVLSLHGPHNVYLPPAEMNSFEMGLSKKMQGIGVSVEKAGEDIRVEEILAGGPASKNGRIAAGDLLLEISQDGEKPVVVTGFSISEVVHLLRGEQGTRVNLALKKQDGRIDTVSIIRDAFIMKDQLAKSLILENETLGEKAGYIQLTRFYTSFDGDGPSCGDDVYREIEKLKQQDISGLIIDLRDNIGGSLNETIRMIGFFIESGPVVQREGRGGEVRVLYDTDPMVLYDGELIILTNARSGSASELFSATLHDYDRAVVVGSTSTFGKGTIQSLVGLDEIAQEEEGPLGAIKLTVGKFYRISGSSTQMKGVQPDIVLPYEDAFLPTGERALEHALPWTEIGSLAYRQRVNINPNLEAVKALSRKRVEASPHFRAVQEEARRRKQAAGNSLVELNYHKFKRAAKAQQQEARNRPLQPAGKFKIKLADTSGTACSEAWLQEISEDIYLGECLFVLHDLLNEI